MKCWGKTRLTNSEWNAKWPIFRTEWYMYIYILCKAKNQDWIKIPIQSISMCWYSFWQFYVEYRKTLLLRCIRHFKSDLINNMDQNAHFGYWTFISDPKPNRVLSKVWKQNISTEGCSKLKCPETRQVQERLGSTLKHMQVLKWDRTRCPEE